MDFPLIAATASYMRTTAPSKPGTCDTTESDMPISSIRDSVNQFRKHKNGQVVLVLQGGGALGAYQVGVYQALHEAGVEPDWIIGTSIWHWSESRGY